jgi:Glycosyl hydrolases family 16
VFDTVQVKQDRPRPDADRMIVARSTGAAQRNARWHELTEAETAELEEIAAGLTDLLAEVTEILTGFHQGDLEEPEAKAATELCRLTGADETLIPQRLEGERRQAAIARRMPPSGPAAASARQRPQRGLRERPRLLTGGRGSWLLAATILVIAAAVVTALRLLPASSAGPTPVSSAGPTPASSAGPTPASSAGPTPVSSAGPTPASSARPTPVSSAGPTPMPTGVPGAWTLKFDDEFNGTGLDTANWSTGWFGSGITPPVNSQEEDCYDPAQVAESDGALDLTLIQKGENCGISDPQYTTGLVSTKGKFSFTYGFIEARVWLPSVPGTPGEAADWPGVWLDGQNWPEDGEIDIAEGLGGRVCAHFHGPANPQGIGAGNGTGCPGGTYTDGWHTFAANWEPGTITYYYDGIDIGSVTSQVTSAPMFVVLDYAAGHPFQAPVTMKIDYVRIWQHA